MNAILNDDMTRAEAETINRSIKDHITETRAMLLEMRDRRGWKVLGYASFEDYGSAELGFSKVHLYRLASAAEIQANLESNQLVTRDAEIPESQLRPLAQLPAQEQVEAFQAAQARAETENGGKVTAKIVENVVRERTSRTKPTRTQEDCFRDAQDETAAPQKRNAVADLDNPRQQAVEAQTESTGDGGRIGDEGPLILADDIPQVLTLDCSNSESWETQLGEILKLIEALPPIYRLYASHATNKIVYSSAVREWENHPASNAESVEIYKNSPGCAATTERVAMSMFIDGLAIPAIFQALFYGKIDTYPAVLIACLPQERQSAAMERLGIPIDVPPAENSIPNEFKPDVPSREAQDDTGPTGIDGNESGNARASELYPRRIKCTGCINYHADHQRCDAGYAETIQFPRTKKVSGKVKPNELRECDGYKSCALAGMNK